MDQAIEAALSFSIPDGMREMTPEEYAKYFRASREKDFALYNEEKHTILAVLYKKRPLIVGRAASAEACLKVTEKNIKKLVPETYENTGYGHRAVDGHDACTFCFRYVAQQDIRQAGEYILCRFSRYDCSFELIYREEFQAYAEQKLEEFLTSVKFKKS